VNAAAIHRREAGAPATGRRPYAMLAMATLGFGLGFWAWALLSPLGAHFKQGLALTSFQQALLVAVPVIVGALGRIPVGALTDRFGGRLMFPVVSFTARCGWRSALPSPGTGSGSWPRAGH
jgi:MFS transporter, NNP family, nitrate/nitrite transporter